MNGELGRFLEKVKTDPELQERIASMQTAAEVIEEAAQRGFNFSESDMAAASEAGSITSSELGTCKCQFTGNGSNSDDPDGTVWYICTCTIVGVGNNGGGGTHCLCFTQGMGDENSACLIVGVGKNGDG